MKQNTFTVTDPEGYKIFTYQWLPDGAPFKAAIMLVHGMAEHSGRYQRLAEALTGAGYLVYAQDCRGHGRTAGTPEKIGYQGRDGFNGVIADLHQLSGLIQKENPGLPLVIFGHSMGSFLVQQYIEEYGHELRGAILSGTCGPKGIAVTAGIFLAWLIVHVSDPGARNLFLHKKAFAGYNRKFKPERTPFDWLTRDNAEVDRYIADPYCGTVFSSGFYYDLFRALRRIHRMANIQKIPKELPVYIFAGSDDPVGEYGRGVQKLITAYQRVGIRDLSWRIYPGGRHEMLNETNRDEVTRDLLFWLNERF